LAATLGDAKAVPRMVLAPSAAKLARQDDLCFTFIVFPLRM
jgi:hypothetical protein